MRVTPTNFLFLHPRIIYIYIYIYIYLSIKATLVGGKVWEIACSVADSLWCSHRETQQRNITD